MSDDKPVKASMQEDAIKHDVIEFVVHGEFVSRYVTYDNEHFKNLCDLLDLPESGTLSYRPVKRFSEL
jgi:hypothetical protein